MRYSAVEESFQCLGQDSESIGHLAHYHAAKARGHFPFKGGRGGGQ